MGLDFKGYCRVHCLYWRSVRESRTYSFVRLHMRGSGTRIRGTASGVEKNLVERFCRANVRMDFRV